MEIKPFGSLRCNGWAISSTIIVSMIVLLGLNVILHLLDASSQTWVHIRDVLLWEYVVTSTQLALGVLILSTVVAVSLAWFVTVYDFPGRRLLSVGLVLPLAIPPFIGATTYVGFLGYTGMVQSGLRGLGVQVPPGALDIMSLKGAVVLFSVFLYPYTYMIVRSFLAGQSSQFIEAGRTLGRSPGGVFLFVVLPLARNAVVAGGTLVVLEVLSDYGVVSFFGLPVFGTAIFKAWISFSDVQAALRLSAILLVVVLLITWSERALRDPRRSVAASTRPRPIQTIRARGWTKVGIMLFTYGVFAIGVLVPLGQMIVWAVASRHAIRYHDLGAITFNSMALGLSCSAIILVFALIVANYRRHFPNRLSSVCSRLAVTGYSIPGAVIAVTVLLFFVEADRLLSTGLSRTLIMVITGYSIRYMAVAFQAVESGFEGIGTRFTETARTLGHGRLASLLQIDIPMMKDALVTAYILTFVDIVKELPLVLLLRPFNFSTLATKVFEYAHDEMIPESSMASLMIVGLSALPMVFLHIMKKRSPS